MNVQDAMAEDVWTCRREDPLSAAAKLMWEHDLGALPVVEDGGGLCGIITDRDICMAAYFSGKPLNTEKIGSHMTTPVFTAGLRDTLDFAEEMMRTKQVRRLPVLDGSGRLVGIVSLSDIARASVDSGFEVGEMCDVAVTVAAIGRPRTGTTASASS